MLLIKIAKDICSIMIPVYCRYTAVYEPFFNKLADPPGFEPESEAPEASMLSKLYYESW